MATKCHYWVTAVIVWTFAVAVRGQVWQSASYYGTPIQEDAVGSTIFDPGIGSGNPQCYGTVGVAIISLISCPVGDSISYFNISSQKVILGAPYLLNFNGHSSTIPSCVLGCRDSSTSTTVFTSLTIFITTSNVYSPVFNSSFPRFISLTLVYYPQLVMQTDAYDLDVDKATSGYVTYSVSTIDGLPISTGVNDYLKYENNGTNPRLFLYRDPGWLLNTTHTVVLLARDNPFIQANRKSTTVSVTIYYAPGITTTSTTVASNVSTSSTVTASTETVTAAAQGVSSSTAVNNECEALKLLICGNNWIWLIVSVSGFIILVVGIIVIAYCMRKTRITAAKHPPPVRYERPPPVAPLPAPGPPPPPPPSYQHPNTVEPERRRPNPFMEMYNEDRSRLKPR